MSETIENVLKDIERVLTNKHLSVEMRIDYVTSIFNLRKNMGYYSNTLSHVAGDILHSLVKDHISNFRKYIPLMLRIYSGLTNSIKTCYLGYTPGKEIDNDERDIMPSISLKACFENDRFRWGAGEIFEGPELQGLSSITPRIINPMENMFEGIQNLCKNAIKECNGLIIPLFLNINNKHFKNTPYGFIMLISEDSAFSEMDLKLANKATSYFTAHLTNFERLRKDQLTKLYNQRQKTDLFTSETTKAIQNEYGIGLLMIDIDHFKDFNDKYGHLNGDALLAQFGKLLLKSIRPHDRPVRIGGEEFLIITPKVDYESLKNLAERLRVSIENHVFEDRFGKSSYNSISASIGALLIENIKGRVGDPEYYLDLVDRNLFEAKRKGRNIVVTTRC
ncbi:response regulator PleD [bacterium BMS3Abin07]|nr:response regulator PleD [bacterium BMS3Abin07]GBE31491.1 response regulator PleD [bacterium BMS3Bbin05]HDO23279.1 GGDEF domain-containing protein [Nitrospirota bacterium]HDZ88197.1 GGDEF domain-containing protein [Nitrospirota bacterium]